MTVVICTFIFIVQFYLVIAIRKGLVLISGQQKPVSILNKSDAISIIIPFYNEGNRILPLLNRLNEMDLNWPVEFIFVNDKSTDNTVSVIKESLQVNHIIVNNQYRKGKKWAIKFGVQNAVSDFIITWDADVIPAHDYFSQLRIDKNADFAVLPVSMIGSKFIQRLGAIEFYFLQFLSFGRAGIGKPVLCNGANLGFKKDVFLQLDKNRNDYHISSGDDMFLLEQMIINNRNIMIYNKPINYTHAPDTLFALLKQRRRWFGKMNNISINNVLLFGILLVVIQLTFVFCSVGLFYSSWFIIPLIVKMSAEWFLLNQIKKVNVGDFLVLIVHQVWYPIYLLLLFLPFSKEDKWM